MRNSPYPAARLDHIGDLLAFVRVADTQSFTAAAEKLVKSIAPRFKDRVGGYTRVIKIAPRFGDGAPMAMVELLDRPAEKPPAAPESGKKAEKKNKAEKPKKEKKSQTRANDEERHAAAAA